MIGTAVARAATIGLEELPVLIRVAGSQVEFPPRCACCDGPADNAIMVAATDPQLKRDTRITAKAWRVPYCTRCLQHIRGIESANSLAWLLSAVTLLTAGGLSVAALAAGGVWVYVAVGLGIPLTVIMLAGIVGIHRARAAAAVGGCGPQCAGVRQPVRYLGWSGGVNSFRVGAPRYARSLMLANRPRLVEVSPEANRLMSDNVA